MVSSPTYDPNKLATHDFAGRRHDQAAARRTHDRAAAEPRDRGDAAARVDVQAGHRGGGAGQSGSSTPTRRSPAAPRLDLPQTSHGPRQRERRRLRRRPDHAHPCARGLLQRRVRLARAQARRGRHARRRPRSSASAPDFTDLDDSLTKQAISHFPDATRTRRRPALSAIGQYDVARHPAADGDGVAGHRQQRQGDEALPRRRGAVARPRRAQQDRPRAVLDQQRSARPTARELTEMMVAVVDSGTGGPRRSRASRSPARPAPRRARPDRPPYAWFVSFAPADDPKVAVAVLVEDAGVARDADLRQRAGRADRQGGDGGGDRK